jgi:hypothetical protein
MAKVNLDDLIALDEAMNEAEVKEASDEEMTDEQLLELLASESEEGKEAEEEEGTEEDSDVELIESLLAEESKEAEEDEETEVDEDEKFAFVDEALEYLDSKEAEDWDEDDVDLYNALIEDASDVVKEAEEEGYAEIGSLLEDIDLANFVKEAAEGQLKEKLKYIVPGALGVTALGVGLKTGHVQDAVKTLKSIRNTKEIGRIARKGGFLKKSQKIGKMGIGDRIVAGWHGARLERLGGAAKKHAKVVKGFPKASSKKVKAFRKTLGAEAKGLKKTTKSLTKQQAARGKSFAKRLTLAKKGT